MKLHRRHTRELVAVVCPVCKNVEPWRVGHIICNGGHPYTRFHDMTLMELVMVNEKGELIS